MELPPNQQQKGFFSEGVDASLGKGKAPITALENKKAAVLESAGPRAYEVLRQWKSVNPMLHWRPPPVTLFSFPMIEDHRDYYTMAEMGEELGDYSGRFTFHPLLPKDL